MMDERDEIKVHILREYLPIQFILNGSLTSVSCILILVMPLPIDKIDGKEEEAKDARLANQSDEEDSIVVSHKVHPDITSYHLPASSRTGKYLLIINDGHSPE